MALLFSATICSVASAADVERTQSEKRPNETQAWRRLWTIPPAGYAVTTGKEKGEDCLNMPSVKSLCRSGFKKRWKDYTANNTE